jgi:hypothetical protein
VTIAKNPLADVIPMLTALGVRIEIDPSVAAAAQVQGVEATFTQEQGAVLGQVLDALVTQAGLAWTIDETGTVWIVARPK